MTVERETYNSTITVGDFHSPLWMTDRKISQKISKNILKINTLNQHNLSYNSTRHSTSRECIFSAHMKYYPQHIID